MDSQQQQQQGAEREPVLPRVLPPDDVESNLYLGSYSNGETPKKRGFLKRLSRQESQTLASQLLQLQEGEEGATLEMSSESKTDYGSLVLDHGTATQVPTSSSRPWPRQQLDALTQSITASLGLSYTAPSAPVDDVSSSLGVTAAALGRARVPVVLCCSYLVFLCNIFIGGLGVLYVPLLQQFNASSAQTGLVQSLCNGVLFGGGLFSGAVVSTIGPGWTAMLGSLMATLGCLASFFAQNVPTLIATVGIIVVSGLSLLLVASWSAIGQLSEALPALSSTFIGTASGVGSLVGPILIQVLLALLGWRGVYMILAGLALNGLPAGAFILVQMRRAGNAASSKTTGSKGKTWRDVIRPELMTDWRYVIYVVIAVPWYATAMAPNLFLVDVAADLGLDVETGAQCLAVMGGMGVLGRMLPALMRRMCGCTSILAYSIFSVVGGLSAATITLAYDLPTLMATCAFFGVNYGGFTMCLSQGPLDEFRHHPALSAAVGYVYGISGLGDVISGPLGGSVRDTTGKYNIVFWSCAVIGAIQGVLYLVIHCSCRNRPERKDYETLEGRHAAEPDV